MSSADIAQLIQTLGFVGAALYGVAWWWLRRGTDFSQEGVAWALADGLTLTPLLIVVLDYAGLSRVLGIDLLGEMVKSNKGVLTIACVVMISGILTRLPPKKDDVAKTDDGIDGGYF